MSLKSQKILIIDCQTTGVHPAQGHLLELAWCWTSADAVSEPEIHSRLIALPEGASIPSRVREMTGISEADLIDANAVEHVRELFLESLKKEGGEAIVSVIHYAQFEKPFLCHLLKRSEEDAPLDTLPFEVVCSHQLVKKLFPQLPSRNIRGVSGFFGSRISDLRRAAAHVRATSEIWRGLVDAMESRGIRDVPGIHEFLKAAPKTKPARYEYRVDKEKRLNLPDRPGVYRMIAKNGEILYVGKATSLKDRVSSYFRGKRGRDKRKLEMMAQVWDLQVTECRTALEAAVLETDEIKRFDPPYNVSLKSGKRRLVFYSRDFDRISEHQDGEHPLGPFKPFNSIERLIILKESLSSPVFGQVFYELFPEKDLAEGFRLFCERHGVEPYDLMNVRSQLALGMKLLRLELAEARAESDASLDDLVEETEEEAIEQETQEESVELSPEEIADKYERLFLRAAKELWRARRLTRLLNSRVRWQSGEDWAELELRDGRLATSVENAERAVFPWSKLEIADYDRMSVLFSELNKYPHEIRPVR